MHSLIVWENDNFETDLPLSAISGVIANQESIAWLDITNPTEQDITLLLEEFKFHPLAVEDAVRLQDRPKIDVYATYYYILFYAAYYNELKDEIDLQPLSLFIGHNYLVTVHPGDMPHIADVRIRWQAPGIPLKNKVGSLAHELLDGIVDGYFPVIDKIAERIEAVEGWIFESFEHVKIETIFDLRKELLTLRLVLAPERDVLNTLLRRELQIFKPKDVAYLRDVYDHIARVLDSTDIYRDMLSTALDSYLSIQSNTLNQSVRILTIASIILMADALIAGIYGMNFVFMPELHWTFGYPIALLLMVVVSAALLWFFRHKKWL